MPSFSSPVAKSARAGRPSNIPPSLRTAFERAVDRFLGRDNRDLREATDDQCRARRFVGQLFVRHQAAREAVRSASAASIMRAVSTMSIALLLRTARGRRCVPPAPRITATHDVRRVLRTINSASQVDEFC